MGSKFRDFEKESKFMETFIAVLHIMVALILIVLVLVQDSKSGGMGGAFGGGGSNSVFGATGATTLAQQLTRIVAGIFAVTCVALTIFSARSHKSVIDALGAPTAPAAAKDTAAPAPAPEATPTSAPPAENPSK
jgi:preprotein translocase subunit SecG